MRTEEQAMIRIKRWYWVVVGVWLVTGLPIYLIGQGFAGPDNGAFTLSLLLRSLRPPLSDIGVFLEWLLIVLLMFLPLILLPWAIIWKRLDRENHQ
jgi:uncharacterized membrane protein YhaH (DUF805 family)